MKYIIEIENEPFGRNDDPFFPHGMDELYRAKGFKSLVFDQNGLDKLTPYTEPDREAIENEVWEFIFELVTRHRYELDDCFGTDSMCEIMSSIPYSEAKAQYGEWKAEKAKKDEIRIGDEVIYHGNKYVVGYVGVDEVYHIVSRNWMRVVVQGDYQIFKTGRHFPEVAELLKKMREEE